MKNNKKTILLILITITTLILLSTASATQDTNTTTTSSIKEKTTTTEPVVKEVQKQEQNPEKQATKNKEKIIKENKTEKQTKTNIRTVEVNNYNELVNAINQAVNDTENQEYIINLNVGTYQITKNTNLDYGIATPNITINANNQILKSKSTSYMLTLKNKCNININDADIEHRITNKYNLTVKNSLINQRIQNDGNLTIYDDVTFGSKFSLTGSGNLISNNTNLKAVGIYVSNTTITNENINSSITNLGNLIITNSTLNSTITNKGNLTITDDCNLGENLKITGNNGNLITNKTIDELLPHISEINGNYTIKNKIINQTLTLRGNIKVINCTFSEPELNYFWYNYGILTLNNCSTVNLTRSGIKNYNILVINDNTEIISGISGNGTIFYGEPPEGYFEQPTEYNGENTQENMTLIRPFTNNGNLTLKNCTIKTEITNNGKLIITDDTIFEDTFILHNNGEIIINDTNRILPYFKTYEGNTKITNSTINLDKINNGNTTFINCNINAKITNNGNITLINSSLSNNQMTSDINTGFLIENYGNVTMSSCVVENNTFEMTGSNPDVIPSGVIHNKNNATLSLNNTRFHNNTNIRGDNSLIYNLGVINYLNNCSFTNNNNISCYVNKEYRYNNHDYNPDEFTFSLTNLLFGNNTYPVLIAVNTLTITDSLFENNSAKVFSVANMSVINSKFINNKYVYLGQDVAGFASADPYGIAISANNLFVNNCTFDENGIISKGQYTQVGDYGGAIKASKLFVNNSVFKNNIVNTSTTWNPNSGTGAAIFMGNGEIYNSIFENNYAFNPSQKNLPTIGSESYGGTSTEGRLPGSGADIYSSGNIIIINNTFKNSYAKNQASSIYAYVRSTSTLQNNITITNNTFNGCKSSLDTIVIEHSGIESDIILENNIYTNTTINDELTLNLPSKFFAGEEVTITGTYNIVNTSFYDPDILEQNKFNIYINGVLKQTLDTLEFNITPTNGNMILTVQPTISQTRKTEAIRATTLTDILITPENYNEYFYEGRLVGVTKDSRIRFQGEFKDKGEIFIDTNDLIIDGSNATFTNTIFTLEGNNTIFQNMNITNVQTNYPIINTGDNNTITKNKININNTEGKTAAIYNKASNTEISYNTISVDGPAYSTDFSQGLAIANTQTILLIGGDANTIEYNNITLTSSTESSQFGTIEAITNSLKATNTQIRNNNITVKGNAKFNYGINGLGNVKNITIQENNLLITGERYTAGIQTGDSAENILIENNNIKCICHNTTPVDEEAITYGIITTNSNLGYKDPESITIQENNITLTGTVNYGIEIYHTKYSGIYNNNIQVNGAQSMGIGLAYSPDNYITGNNITTQGDSTIPLKGVTEEIQPRNVGVQIQQTSNNILVWFNNIQTYDKGGQDTCVNVESNGASVGYNNLTSTTKVGNDAVNGQTDTTIQDNTAIQQNSTTQTATEDLTTGDSTTLTAQFYDDTYTPAGDGKAIFKVNGKTLRDNNGNVIYADVINGRAELPDVNITQEWTKEGTTIQAVYVGDDNNEPIITEPTTVTVTKPEATIILDAPTEATAGTTITLKATVTDGENNITSGRVAFKLNGKTLKDPKTGKALYANVENGIATITYTIPPKTKAKEYTLTAVFTDTKYDRVEAESKLNVVKA